ncbi:MAG: hypothetical protein IKP82_07980 [Oscillospiraceae bacterium]|nr:hypothetical protein [Oscillospiraceae bacterium]
MRCGGHSFTARGKTVQDPGWKVYAQQQRKHTLPELTEGQVLHVSTVTVREGKTTPPRHYTEDTLLSGMETAGAGDMPDDAERKGLGTPATRAALIAELTQMRSYLGDEDSDLRALTDSAIGKLEAMTDEDYAALDLTPDFDAEDNDGA